MEFNLWVSVLVIWTTVVWNAVNPNPMAYRGNLAKPVEAINDVLRGISRNQRSMNDLSSEFAKDIRDIGIAANENQP